MPVREVKQSVQPEAPPQTEEGASSRNEVTPIGGSENDGQTEMPQAEETSSVLRTAGVITGHTLEYGLTYTKNYHTVRYTEGVTIEYFGDASPDEKADLYNRTRKSLVGRVGKIAQARAESALGMDSSTGQGNGNGG